MKNLSKSGFLSSFLISSKNYKKKKCHKLYNIPENLNKGSVLDSEDFPLKGKSIRIFTWNCRSLRARYDELKEKLIEEKWEVVQLQETWLNAHKDKIKFKGYKQITTNGNKKRGGGTMTLVRDDLTFKRIKILNEMEDLESIFIELQAKEGKTFILGKIYVKTFIQEVIIEQY